MVFWVVMYGCQSWTTETAECQRIDASELGCWKRLLRVPWTARRSKQSVLKEISPEYSLEGLMLKLKRQYFGHQMRRADSLEKSDTTERLNWTELTEHKVFITITHLCHWSTKASRKHIQTSGSVCVPIKLEFGPWTTAYLDCGERRGMEESSPPDLLSKTLPPPFPQCTHLTQRRSESLKMQIRRMTALNVSYVKRRISAPWFTGR